MDNLTKVMDALAASVLRAKWPGELSASTASESLPAGVADEGCRAPTQTMVLDLLSRSELDELMPRTGSFLLVPLGGSVPTAGWLELRLRLGAMRVREVQMRCHLALRERSQWRHGRELIRVQPDAASWKRLFLELCRVSWTRKPASADVRGRARVDEAVFCLLPSTGMSFEAKLSEVSAGGAFLCLEPVLINASESRASSRHSGGISPGASLLAESERMSIANGESVRFRRLQDMTWHSAEVRWQGRKHRQLGVGLALSFARPEDKNKWSRYVGAALSVPT